MQRALPLTGIVLGFLCSGRAFAQPAPPPDLPDPPAVAPEPPPEPPPAPPPMPMSPPVQESQASPRLAPELHVDEGAAPPERQARRERGFVGIEIDIGMHLRLSDAAGFDRDERVGATYGAAVWLNLFENAALGLELGRAELGRAAAQSGQNVINAEFSSTAAWLSGRLIPVRTSWLEGFVALRAGLALQHVDAHGVRQTAAPLEPASAFSCTEIDGPALGFGGGLGARLGVGKGLALVSRLDGTVLRLSSDVVGGCASGVGSTTSVSLGLGLLYEAGSSGSDAASARRTRQTW